MYLFLFLIRDRNYNNGKGKDPHQHRGHWPCRLRQVHLHRSSDLQMRRNRQENHREVREGGRWGEPLFYLIFYNSCIQEPRWRRQHAHSEPRCPARECSDCVRARGVGLNVSSAYSDCALKPSGGLRLCYKEMLHKLYTRSHYKCI